MPATISGPAGTATFVYDGDGNRVMKVENGEAILYVNQYFEKNLTTGEETSYYYLGSRRIAFRKGDDLEYTHNDHLTSTSVTTDSTGAAVATVKYFPFGTTRLMTGDLQTDHLFTGQRLDETGLYYYNARYYDSTIGRFISPDSIVPNPFNPQSFNRYSYTLNNPLVFIDPTGHWGWSNVSKWCGDRGNNIVNGAKAVGGAVVDVGEAVVDAGETAVNATVDAAVWVGDQAYNGALDTLSVMADTFIPEGQTMGIGLNITLGIPGMGISGSLQIVGDGYGGVGINWSGGGGGGFFGLGGSVGAQFQHTNANTVEQLRGTQIQAGISAAAVPIAGGIEYVRGIGDTPYDGYNVQVGYGGELPWTLFMDLHGFGEQGGVKVLRTGNYPSIINTGYNNSSGGFLPPVGQPDPTSLPSWGTWSGDGLF